MACGITGRKPSIEKTKERKGGTYLVEGVESAI
jgi:hypothetical protein